jgi:hypothetical protein
VEAGTGASEAVSGALLWGQLQVFGPEIAYVTRVGLFGLFL